MFVDASAIVAILTREPEADALADLLDAARAPITSPIALFEAALGICRKRHASVEEAEEDVREFLRSGRSRARSDHREGSRDGTLRVFALWQRTRPPRAAQPRRLLCLRRGQEPPQGALVQGRRFRQDRHPLRESLPLNGRRDERGTVIVIFSSAFGFAGLPVRAWGGDVPILLRTRRRSVA